jgi:hypothetical protein
MRAPSPPLFVLGRKGAGEGARIHGVNPQMT